MENSEKIIIVGDLFPVPTNFCKFSDGDIDYLFGEEIYSLFKSADYRICNLEGALTDTPGKCEKTGAVLHAPTTTVNAYKKIGFDCCTLANNHITDAGPQGLIDTMNVLDKAGIRHLGSGKNENDIRTHLFFKVGNRTIGLYNVAETMYNAPTQTLPGAHLYDEYLVCKELESIKQQCDYLIVIYHGGAEKFRYPSPQTKKRFHRMVDSGANVILSQHTHCVGSEEYYKGAYLLYGQGNFLFRAFNDGFSDTGLIIELVFKSSQVKINRFLVNAYRDGVRLDDNQDFSEFEKRSSLLLNDEFVRCEYEKYCLSNIKSLLATVTNNDIMSRLIRKAFPKQYYQKMVYKPAQRNRLLRVLHSLRSEQNREAAIIGLQSFLKL